MDLFRRTIEKGCQYADGVVMWNLSLLDSDPDSRSHWSFAAGGTSKYAGRSRRVEFQSRAALSVLP